MKQLFASVITLTLIAFPAHSKNSPSEMSCVLGDVIAQNRGDDVRPTLLPMTGSWPEDSREAAIEQLEDLLRTPSFVHASVYLVGKLGEDVEDHLLVLRLARGEVAGARLTYEWTRDGFMLTGMDFKSDVKKLMEMRFLQEPELIACTS